MKLQNVQQLMAYNAKLDKFDPVFIYYDQFYKIQLENESIVYGWLNTSEEELTVIHKMAGFSSLDQLIILDYCLRLDNPLKPQLTFENKIYDVQREVKYIIPTNIVMLKQACPTSNGTIIDAIISGGERIPIHKDLPIFIEELDGKKYKGFIQKIGKRGLFGRKDYLDLLEIRDIHPKNTIITIDFQKIKKAYPLMIQLR